MRTLVNQTLLILFCFLNSCGTTEKLIADVKKNKYDGVQSAIDRGANVNGFIKDENGGLITPLMVAVHYEHIKIADLLIKNGANIFAIYKDDISVFDLALNSNNSELIKIFVNASKAPIN